MVDRGAQLGQVVFLQARVEQLELHALFDVGGQGLGVEVGHLVMGGGLGDFQEAQGFGAQGVHQQASGDVGVVRLTLDQGTRGHHQGGVDVGLLDAVVQVLQGFFLDQRAIDFFEAFAGFGDDGVQAAQIQRRQAAVGALDADARVGIDRYVDRAALALLAARFTVDHVVAGDFLLAGTHQGQFDLVLDFFDVDGAAGGHAALEGGGDLLGQARHGVMDARRGGGIVAFHCEKRLGDGDGDLVIGVGDDCTVALDHAQLARRSGGQVQRAVGGVRVLANGLVLHGVSGFSLSR